MNKYDDLTQLLQDQLMTKLRNDEANEQFLRKFISSFRDYLGIPASYQRKSLMTEVVETREYFVYFNDTGVAIADAEQVSFSQAFFKHHNGVFGITFGIVLALGSRRSQRHVVQMTLTGIRDCGTIDLELENLPLGKFQDDASASDFNDAYGLMYESLKEWLRLPAGLVSTDDAEQFVLLSE